MGRKIIRIPGATPTATSPETSLPASEAPGPEANRGEAKAVPEVIASNPPLPRYGISGMDPQGTTSEDPQRERRPGPLLEAIRRGPVGAMGNDLLSNSLRDIEPHMIDDDGPRDRLAIDEASIAELVESIKVHGQIVPIMVRPDMERPSRFKIVYGRRRLAALKALGIKAKAIIRKISDEEAIISQGQENSARLNPSFIEKALFADQLRAAGHSTDVISDALTCDKPTLSRMSVITKSMPMALIVAIGAAPDIGRRRWGELLELLEHKSPEDPVAACFPDGFDPSMGSNERFEAACKALSRKVEPARSQTAAKPVEIVLKDGRKIARLKQSAKSTDLSFSAQDNPAFAAWLAEKAETVVRQIYRQWADESEG